MKSLWFVIVAFFWVGFFVLEGFDFGVGMLHSFVARNDAERRVAINTIGPVWDGNEVWLVVAGAGTFAAFPLWYSTMFSAFYLALLIVLLALMVRGVSFEYRGKLDDPRWRTAWKWSMTLGCAIVPLLIGVALGDLLHGLPINKSHIYTGSFWNLLVPYGIYTGLTLVALSLLSGATFLALKTAGELHDRAADVARGTSVAAALMVGGFVVWTSLVAERGYFPNIFAAIAVLAVLAATWLAGNEREGWAFAASSAAMGAAVTTIFAELYSNVMVSSTSATNNLTVGNAAASSYALTVMTVVACIFLPLVLGYQAWSYHVFRRRLAAPRADAQVAEAAPAATSAPDQR
ncbi:MAG TPA: cytochrome d ubiquinol oxidase subunit II [Acidimicrobiales bacterium]|nr:cytochrome d ubiquinol oxidase subunit II [Acidimicrobiales bacterium]